MSGGHTQGPYTVYVEQVDSPLMAAIELGRLVRGTKGFSGVLPMVVAANGLCVAVTGCGPDGLKNATLFAAAPELLAMVQQLIREACTDRDGAPSIVTLFDAKALVEKATGQVADPGVAALPPVGTPGYGAALIALPQTHPLPKTLPDAVLSLNAAWNQKAAAEVIAGLLDLCRRLALMSVPADDLCEGCNGSGETTAMTHGHGPDDYDVSVNCHKCGGSGVKKGDAA